MVGLFFGTIGELLFMEAQSAVSTLNAYVHYGRILRLCCNPQFLLRPRLDSEQQIMDGPPATRVKRVGITISLTSE
jgi:hypothetical protein